MNGLRRGAAAVVGAAESDLGAVAAQMSSIDLMAQGIRRALDDCGLALRDVDGIFCATTQARTSAMSLAEYLGLPDAYTDSTIVGGSSFEVHVAHAMAAIQLGLCSVAAIAYGSTQRTVGRSHASPREFTRTRRRSGLSCRPAPTRSLRPATCSNSAPRASKWPKSQSRRDAGRSSIRWRSTVARCRSPMC